MLRHDDDFGSWRDGMNSSNGLNAVHCRHRDVDQSEVWLDSGGDVDQCAAVAGMSNDLVAILQDSGNTLLHHFVVIRNENGLLLRQSSASGMSGRTEYPGHTMAAQACVRVAGYRMFDSVD